MHLEAGFDFEAAKRVVIHLWAAGTSASDLAVQSTTCGVDMRDPSSRPAAAPDTICQGEQPPRARRTGWDESGCPETSYARNRTAEVGRPCPDHVKHRIDHIGTVARTPLASGRANVTAAPDSRPSRSTLLEKISHDEDRASRSPSRASFSSWLCACPGTTSAVPCGMPAAPASPGSVDDEHESAPGSHAQPQQLDDRRSHSCERIARRSPQGATRS
ncbi:hypothetical protein C8K38_103102 [Rhodococcus sp. OK611]|nr:hypothetical protein C8K38_103102 [Rhodococcus sp. OK611]SNX90047.1 hypothetical protein SAMN05447004_104102 [Rhodococcus sp. OK270]